MMINKLQGKRLEISRICELRASREVIAYHCMLEIQERENGCCIYW
jgi:hypothetical protein